jgi:hypothetical protein
MLRCMSSTRTQIYLTSQQRRKLDARAVRDGTTLASVIRAAVDRYLADEPLQARDALKATFGSLPGLELPTRGEWDRVHG